MGENGEVENPNPADDPLVPEGSGEQAGADMTAPAAATEPAAPATPHPPTRLDRFRRGARWVTLASIFLNALLGVWAVAGSLGEFESRILATSLLVTAAGVVAVACSAAIPEGRLGPLPIGGILASVTGFLLLIVSFWEDFGTDAVWRTGATLVILAAGVAYASLLSAVHLKGHYRRLVSGSYTLAAGAAGFLVAVVWGYHPGDAWRLFGVVAVLLAALTLAVPTTARLRPAQEGPPPVCYCPFCGTTVTGAQERTTQCGSCGHRFRVVGR
jgi:hypothetical protein